MKLIKLEAADLGKLGFIHIITGDGKGKTTSGMGIAIRALGRGLRIKIIQLFKRDTGEQYFFNKIKEIYKCSYVQFKPLHPFFKKYSPENLESLKKELKIFWDQSLVGLEEFDLLIIDEVGPAMKWGALDTNDVKSLIMTKPKNLELVLTGRDFPESIREMADYISEVRPIRHPYQKGIQARIGIEY